MSSSTARRPSMTRATSVVTTVVGRVPLSVCRSMCRYAQPIHLRVEWGASCCGCVLSCMNAVHTQSFRFTFPFIGLF